MLISLIYQRRSGWQGEIGDAAVNLR